MLVALTFAVAVQAAAAPPAAVRRSPLPEHCRERALQYTQNRTASGARKLGDLPPGVLSHAVIKSVDGCPVVVLVQRGPDGRKLEVPAGAAGVTRAPASQRHRGVERRR